eukprot:TRINITY_DN98321_c0_g1_i1.p1 TRINITY_DN98321_c0_g1~~TRINITY_DN98321_c0_g1_i1.p1  ORF type:complete len:181 (+),score=15.10 TRINITY_DN98321_c0_g1_i1:97-639(+)
MGATTSVGCCGSRASAMMLCYNDRLNTYLRGITNPEHGFDSAYVYIEEIRILPDTLCQQYVLIYQRSEILEETKASSEESNRGQQQKRPILSEDRIPRKVHRILRLDWGRDGLAFMELEKRPPDDMLIRSKVLDPALKPLQLLYQLEKVKHRCYDPDGWASHDFSLHMIDQASGKDYYYR